MEFLSPGTFPLSVNPRKHSTQLQQNYREFTHNNQQEEDNVHGYGAKQRRTTNKVEKTVSCKSIKARITQKIWNWNTNTFLGRPMRRLLLGKKNVKKDGRRKELKNSSAGI